MKEEKSPSLYVDVLDPASFSSQREWARTVAEVTRMGYAVASRVPGELPVADGAVEPDESPLDDLHQGGRVLVARTGAGKPVGVIRVVPRDVGLCELRRLAIDPAYRRLGLRRQMVRRGEVEARKLGASRIYFWAVVERLLPPLYTPLGYRPVVIVPAPDKPLSEARMERYLGHRPRPHRGPWSCQAALPASGAFVLWLWLCESGSREPAVRAPQGLYAMVGRTADDLGLRARSAARRVKRSLAAYHPNIQVEVVGLDVDAREESNPESLSGHLGHPQPGGLELPLPAFDTGETPAGPSGLVHMGERPQEVEAFVMPRSVEASLLACMRWPIPRASASGQGGTEAIPEPR